MVNSVPGLIAGILAIALGGVGTSWSDSAETREIITANCEAWNDYSQHNNNIMANYYSDLVTYLSGTHDSHAECFKRGISVGKPAGRPDNQNLVANASE